MPLNQSFGEFGVPNPACHQSTTASKQQKEAGYPVKLAIALLAVLLQITLQATDTPTVADEAAKGHATQLMLDSSFEGCPSGLLASTGDNRGWEIQSIGRKTIQEQLVVACVEDEAKARSGNKCLSLSIPRATEGFEFVTVGQRLGLEVGTAAEDAVEMVHP